MSDQWQPIETAPKDGTRVIIYEPNRVGGCVREASWSADWYGDETNQGWMPANCDEEYGYHCKASHWMPLPDPPHSEHQKKRKTEPVSPAAAAPEGDGTGQATWAGLVNENAALRKQLRAADVNVVRDRERIAELEGVLNDAIGEMDFQHAKRKPSSFSKDIYDRARAALKKTAASGTEGR